MSTVNIESWLLENDYRLWVEGTSFSVAAAELAVAVWVLDNQYAKMRERLQWRGRARKLDRTPKSYHQAQWKKLRAMAAPHLKEGARLLGVARELVNADHTVSTHSLRYMIMPMSGANLRWRDLDEPKGDAILELCETPPSGRGERR